ncbi:hypothetical protein NXW09_29060 [Bacteroides ovatus]|nr:hypothetical protein [Bacteroides ovatus]
MSKQIRKKTSLTFVVGWDAWDAYDQYISDKQVKYSENTEVNRYRFKGKRIVPGRGNPRTHDGARRVLPPAWTPTCGWGWITRNHGHPENRPSGRRQLERFFFQMRMKMDVNIVRPAEIVVHTAYKKSKITHLSSFSISTRGRRQGPVPHFHSTVMAKKINTEETPQTDNNNIPARRLRRCPFRKRHRNLGTNGETEDRLPAKTAGKGNAGSEETTEPHILSLLKKFPAYPSLYIDTHGGTYAPDTAAAIRQGRTLQESFLQRTLKKKS